MPVKQLVELEVVVILPEGVVQRLSNPAEDE